MKIIKWIVVICLILADYTLTEKYAKRHSKDLFNYRIFSRNNSMFFDGYIFNVILGDDTNDNKPYIQHSSKHNAETRNNRFYEFRQKKR